MAYDLWRWETVLRGVDVLVILCLIRVCFCGLKVEVVRPLRSIRLNRGQWSRATHESEDLHKIDGWMREQPSATPEPGADGDRSVVPQRKEFLVHSLFLTQSYRFVCGKDGREWFHYCAGVATEHGFIITDIVPVVYSEQSHGHVRVSDESNIRTLEELDHWGLALLAHVHSHPGSGIGATMPSGTDRRFVSRLARGGHVAIGIIFSRDGYFRVYADSSIQFHFQVVGSHVTQIEDTVYRLTALGGGELPIARR